MCPARKIKGIFQEKAGFLLRPQIRGGYLKQPAPRGTEELNKKAMHAGYELVKKFRSGS